VSGAARIRKIGRLLPMNREAFTTIIGWICSRSGKRRGFSLLSPAPPAGEDSADGRRSTGAKRNSVRTDTVLRNNAHRQPPRFLYNGSMEVEERVNTDTVLTRL